MVLACLLHDASECYMSDIPRPFKKDLPEHQQREDALLEMICSKILGSSLSKTEQKKTTDKLIPINAGRCVKHILSDMTDNRKRHIV